MSDKQQKFDNKADDILQKIIFLPKNVPMVN